MSYGPIIQGERDGAGLVRGAAHVAMVVIGLVPVLMSMSFGLADELPVSVHAAGMQAGMVTAVHEHTVTIDGRDYGFSPKIVVLDHEGKETELSYITRKSEVKFRLMKDEFQKIERIIVYHPE